MNRCAHFQISAQGILQIPKTANLGTIEGVFVIRLQFKRHNFVTVLRYFSEYFLLVTSCNFMLYFYFYFRYFFKLPFYFVTSYFYQKVQKYFCIIHNSQADKQYGLWLLTDQ